jgi:hypothetical protein
VLSARGCVVGYKIFSFLYRFVCVCQYDFYSCVCFYAISVIGGIFGPRIPIWEFIDLKGFNPKAGS